MHCRNTKINTSCLGNEKICKHGPKNPNKQAMMKGYQIFVLMLGSPTIKVHITRSNKAAEQLIFFMQAQRGSDLEIVLLSSAFSLRKHLRDSSKTWKLAHIIVTAATPEQVLFPTEAGETLSVRSLRSSHFYGVNEESKHFKLYAHRLLTVKANKNNNHLTENRRVL